MNLNRRKILLSLALAGLTAGTTFRAQAQPGPARPPAPPGGSSPGPGGPPGPGGAPGPQTMPGAPPPPPPTRPPVPQGRPNRPSPPPSRRHGAGPRRDIFVGSRLPPQYRGPRFVVRDWHRHGLAAPPRGHHWVWVGRDFLLVSDASQRIVRIVFR